jgi:hypothetical protein
MYSTRKFQVGLSAYLTGTRALTHMPIPKVLVTWGRFLCECVVALYSLYWILNICNADCFTQYAFACPLLLDLIPYYYLLTFIMRNGSSKRDGTVQSWK